MDFLTELESMATNVTATTEVTVTYADAVRWQRLFGLSLPEAVERIEQHRNDLARARVSDELWDLHSFEMEAKGYDREAYEYSFTLGSCPKPGQFTTTPASSLTEYVVKLEGPFATAERLQQILCLASLPPILTGSGEQGSARLCTISNLVRQDLVTWLSTHHPHFRPTLVRLSKARKDLCSHSLAPFLGLDTTLPQSRPSSADFVPQPQQDQYPVWYFFYGTLACPEELRSRLNLPFSPQYMNAFIRGGRIRSWRRQYRALVDADSDSLAYGWAFLVTTPEQESALQFYETDKYEVVRTRIYMRDYYEDGMPGLVFRFAGSEEELEQVSPVRVNSSS